jgi:hypothetical protein
MSRRPVDNSDSDEIRREDGVERYWLYYNGEWVETICGLCAAIGGVFWCFLWSLGYRQTAFGYILAAIAVLGLAGLRLVWERIEVFNRQGWQSEPKNTAQNERLYVALALWGFIALCVGAAVVMNYRRGY